MGMSVAVDAAPIRPISAMMMSRARRQSSRQSVEWWGGSVVSVANPFGVGGSGGGVLAPWWPFHTLGKTAGAAPRPRGGSDNVVKQDEFNTTMSIYTTDARSARRPTVSGG